MKHYLLALNVHIVLWNILTGAPVNFVELDEDGSPKTSVTPISDSVSEISLSFLTKYGYLPTPEEGKSYLLSEEGVTNAIKMMQRVGGINETGAIDAETLKLINSPRCGVPDVIDGFENLILDGDDEELEESDGYYPSRKKRYALQGSRWKKRVLTYSVGRYPSKLSRSEVDTDVRKAFDMWQRASGLTFMRRSSGSNVDIEIRFENYYHGDEDAFDGPGGVVAHAFFPEFGGDAHFDDGEDWTVNKYKGVSLLQSVAHELGHSLGLLHSSKYGAMMSPYHKGWTPNLSLDSDDIRAVRKLYGNQVLRAKSSRSSPYKRPTTRKTTTRKPRNYYYYELLKK